jgi:hypothetical protein
VQEQLGHLPSFRGKTIEQTLKVTFVMDVGPFPVALGSIKDIRII